MNVFVDTSSLLKLYYKEENTTELESFFSKAQIRTVYLSEITKIEFASALWRKVRANHISAEQANITLQLFENDFDNYTFIVTNNLIIEKARLLLSKYGLQGLRTLDSIHLSTAVSLTSKADTFITSDALLNTFFEKENLNTKIDIR